MASTFNFLLMLITLAFCSSRILAELTPEQMDLALGLHNEYRLNVNPSSANMLKMSWDQELADKAQRWADNCHFANDPKRYVPSYDSVGQDIYTSSRSEDIVKNAIAAWGGEKKYYNYGNNSCTSGQICGYYTQLVWAKSYKLGMGVSSRKCPSGLYLVVANYAKAGNYAEELPYISGLSASECFAGSTPGPSGMCEVTDDSQLRQTINLNRCDTHCE